MTGEGPRWRRLLPLGAAALVVGVGGALALLPRGAQTVRVAPVVRKALRVTVSCSGVLEPPPGGEVHAPEAGGVASLAVTEGQDVVRGQVLLTLDAPDLALQALQARQEQAQLEAEAASLRLERAEAATTVDARRRVAESDARLVAARALPAAAAEASALALAEAESRLSQLEARLASLAGPGGASRLALSAERARTLAARAEGLTVRAPLDGVVFGLPRRVGEAVTAGQVLASVTRAESPRVRLNVDQPDLPLLAAGQPLVATFDGRPGQRWEGRVLAVSRSLRPSEGRDVADVRGEIADPDRLLPLNARVDVEVLVGQRPAALVAPRGALQRDGQRAFVWVLAQGRAARREVTVGLVGPTEAEILSGLGEGEPVILPGVAPLEPGRRVAPGR